MASTIKRHERLVALDREETLCKSAGSPLDPERRSVPAVTS